MMTYFGQVITEDHNDLHSFQPLSTTSYLPSQQTRFDSLKKKPG